ncbi:fibronectin type III domain-containing protein [Rhizobium leguminosarum]|uniref:fibronectin type III domain-containing protein n=1 Tax=Rhizobium leguminosarum TaxID=384 RepID=UPI001C93FA51|nr:fibronectin type III domain-containing protein [Rhizobium leguminosarum]MBY5396975.1 fibronectin type III domain-containing protein [Rhizobium leguminosarum]
MATNAAKPPTPGDKIWKLAPKSITDWGYALLVLLSIVSVLTGLAKSGSVISVVITIVIVFGLFVALWAFDRMTKSRDPWWKWTGKIAGSVVIAAMIATFVSILSYIVVGRPAWMDAWFRPGYAIDGPTLTNVNVGNLTIEVPKIANSVSMIDWFFAPAMAQDQMARDPRSTLTVTWSPNMQAGTTIEVSIRQHGDEKGFPSPATEVDAGVGRAIIEGLIEGTTYEVQVVARRDGRRSKPQAFQATTNADQHPVPMFDGFVASYTGAMDKDGRPSAGAAHVLLTPQAGRLSQSSWFYDGGFASGFPEGHGTLTTDPNQCTEEICGSRCTGTFKRGSVVSATCSLTLDGFQNPSNVDNNAIIYNDVSKFDGQVSGAENEVLTALAEKDRPKPSALLGPFAIWLNGPGHLRGQDSEYVDVYDGTWVLGSFDKGSRIGTNGGVLASGQRFVQDDCLLVLTPTKAKSIGGFGGRVTCGGIELGEWRDGGSPFRGFSVEQTDGTLFVSWYEDGKMRRLSPSENLPILAECRTDLDYGIMSLRNEPTGSPWEFSCDTDASPFQCTLRARGADVAITGSRPVNGVPNFDILTSGNARGGTTAVSVDGSEFSLPPPGKQLSPINYALLAQMCGSDKFRNEEQKHEVPLDGFCQRLGLMFAQLYTCGVNIDAQGNGPDGKPLHDPDPSLFDPENFITPVFTNDGKDIEFRPVRFNERFYTSHDVVGRLALDVGIGDSCKTVLRQEFPVSSLSYLGWGDRLIFSENNAWSPSLLRHGLEGAASYFQFYQKVPLRDEFRRDPKACYEVSGELEIMYRFKFSFRGTTGVRVFRVTFPTSGLPTLKDLTVANEQDFDVLKKAYEKRLEEKNIKTVFPQEIGIAFAKSGLDVDWQAMSE